MPRFGDAGDGSGAGTSGGGLDHSSQNNGSSGYEGFQGAHGGGGSADAGLPSADEIQSALQNKPNLTDDAGLAKAMWAGLTDDEKAQINQHLGRPDDYNATNRSWRDVVFDATNPAYGSTAYNLGIRGVGVNFDDVAAQEATNPGMTQARMDAVTDVVSRLANLAMPVPMKMAMTAAKAYDAVQKGMPVWDAIGTAAFDIGTPYAAAALNKGVMQAVGPEVAKAIGQFNQVAGKVNVVAPGTLPGINPGAMGVQALKNQLGITNTFNAPLKGVTNPETGAPVDNSFAGFQSGGSGGGSGSSRAPIVEVPVTPTQAPASQVVSPAATTADTKFKFNLGEYGKLLHDNVRTR